MKKQNIFMIKEILEIKTHLAIFDKDICIVFE